MPRELAYPEEVPSKCTGCMICIEQCPFDAIEVVEGLLSGV
jgi:ferredoxin